MKTFLTRGGLGASAPSLIGGFMPKYSGGEVVGNFTILAPTKRNYKDGSRLYEARCNLCNSGKVVARSCDLRKRHSCGCIQKVWTTKVRSCLRCGVEFTHTKPRQDFCSAKCRYEEAKEFNRNKANTDVLQKLKQSLSGAKRRSRNNGMEFNLTTDFVVDLFDGLCSRTGVKLTAVGAFAPSLDRIDNNKGYTKDNVQIVCWMYNRAKAEDTEDMVLKMARGLINEQTGG